MGTKAYADSFTDYLAFLEPRLEEARRLLKPHGSFFLHIDRIPYIAPGLVGPEKAERGKTPTDTWWNTIVNPNGKEKTGYPTQKPLAIINRIIKVHSNPGDRVLDFFAGSGTIGESASSLGRDVVLVDHNPEAIAVMKRRFARMSGVTFHGAEDIAVAARTVDLEAAAAAPSLF